MIKKKKKTVLQQPVMCCRRWERMSQVQERDCLCVKLSHQDAGKGLKNMEISVQDKATGEPGAFD